MKFENEHVSRNGHRIETTQPNLMIFAFKGTSLDTILIVSSQTLNFEMYYFITWWIFFTEY